MPQSDDRERIMSPEEVDRLVARALEMGFTRDDVEHISLAELERILERRQ